MCPVHGHQTADQAKMVSLFRDKQSLFYSALLVVVLLAAKGSAQSCTVANYNKGTGSGPAGCPAGGPYGNYYTTGRSTLTCLVPVLRTFSTFNFNDAKWNKNNTIVAYNNYLSSQLKIVLPNFKDFECRCDKSLDTYAKQLQASFINNGLADMTAYANNPTNVAYIQKMQTFTKNSINSMKGMRCSATVSPASAALQPGPSSPTATSPCKYTASVSGTTLRTSCSCASGKCPNFNNDI